MMRLLFLSRPQLADLKNIGLFIRKSEFGIEGISKKCCGIFKLPKNAVQADVME